MPLIYDDDAGWIAVDDSGMYDDELQNEINAAAAGFNLTASGVAGRDPGMEYRPSGIPNLGSSAPQTAPTFEHIGTPQITLANMAGIASDPNFRDKFGWVSSTNPSKQFMIDVLNEAARMEEDEGYNPVTLAQEAQQLAMQNAPGDPSAQYRALYPDSPSQTPIVIPERPEVATGPNEGDTRVNADGVTETFTNGEWIAETPAAQPPPPEGITVEQIMTALNDGHGVISDWETIFADWPGTDEELQEAVAKLASNIVAVGAGEGGYASQKDQVNALNTLYKAHGGTGVTFTAFTEAAGFNWDTYNPGLGTGSTEGAATAADAAAASATDVGSFFVDYFNTSMEGGGKRWRQAVDEFANILLSKKDQWDQYPGLSGKTFTTADEISQWIYQTYNNELTPEQRSSIEGPWTGAGTTISDPDFFAKTDTQWVAQDPTETATDPNKMTVYRTKDDGSVESTDIDPADLNKYFEDGWNTTTSGTGIESTTIGGAAGIPYAPGVTIPGPDPAKEGIYDPFTTAVERTFAETYPGFAAMQPGYNVPAVQSAYSRAGAPLRTQYSLQLPNLMTGPGDPMLGTMPQYQSAKTFLENLAAGQGNVLTGTDLYSALRGVGGALTADPNALGYDPRTEIWRKQFETTPQQVAAFAQPFLMATRGAPEARTALTQAITNAANRYDYLNPAGVGGRSFLPWALDENLMGINQMFGNKDIRMVNPTDPTIYRAPGVHSNEFWQSPEGMKRQEWDLDIGI